MIVGIVPLHFGSGGNEALTERVISGYSSGDAELEISRLDALTLTLQCLLLLVLPM